MYRSVLEGIALEQALVTGMIEEQTNVRVKEFVAIGGGASSDLWCQVVADAFGKTVRRSEQYAELLGIYREIYPQLRETFSRLSRFAAQG
jgi:sugar (pentulose or hexulose) kinase